MDWQALQLLLIVMAVVAGTLLLMGGFCMFLDAIIGYENDVEADPEVKDFEDLAVVTIEKYEL